MDLLPWNPRAAAKLALVFLISLVLTIALQARGGAYGAEWSGDPDEPAHYVTGLMLHDYIAQKFPGSPLAYAARYYDFYPKVAIGHWPPMFYLIQALWTLTFSTFRGSLLLLMATLGALWLTASYALIASCFPSWMAWISVAFLSTTADFQDSSRMVMAEVPVALFILLALRSLGRYLDSSGPNHEDWRDMSGYSAASLAAVFTKGTAIALAPMSFLCAIAGRRWDLLRSFSFWALPLLSAIVATPWFLLAPGGLHQKVAMLGGLGRFIWWRIPNSFVHWGISLGAAGSVLALIGCARKTWAICAGTEKRGLWIAVILFLPVTLACRGLFGEWDAKHLLTTLPLLMLCAGEGIEWILEKVPGHRTLVLAAIIAALSVTAVRAVVSMPRKVHLGLDQVARELVAAPDTKDSKGPFLILSDATGEGVFIAEVAGMEKRPGHVIERGTKTLADMTFMGDQVQLFFTTPEQLMRFFEKTPNRIVIVDGVEPDWPFMGLVRETLRRYSDRWDRLGTYPRNGARLPVEVFRLKMRL